MTPIAGSTAGPCCLSGDGGPAASAHLKQPFGLAVDAQGNLYIADTGNNRIRKITATAEPSGSTQALTTYGRAIETDLSQLARGRATLKSTLAGVASCSLAPQAAGARLATVIANRQLILTRLRALHAPTAQSARILSLLASALAHSIAADRHYRNWLRYLQGQPRCSTSHNRDYVAAQREDRLATAAKQRFVAAFNPLARQLHQRTWSAARF